MEQVVGVIGLGIMGGAMARNLRAAGWRVLGFDTDPGRCAALAADGIEIGADAVALAREAPVLLTSLPKPEALHATAAALAGAGLPPRTLVETSTFALADKLAAEAVLRGAGHVALDCPLSGTGAQAVERDLIVYASGDSAAIAGLGPFFAGFAKAAHDLGAYGNGTRMKYVANLLVAIHNLASAEAMVLARKAGLDPHQVVGLVQGGAGNSRVFELRAPMMAEGVYEPPTMRVSMWQKDMAVIGEFAAALGCPVPLFQASQPYYAAAMAQGLAGADTAAVHAVLERMAGLPPPV
ncbi:NAD(P)-dependent oxidoreductase [Belnapia sp. T6]|uniref:NAD(P)-dependent oxidoreductase n=1 Tax=Belnapia mucosa TaxID=2804532 RepID=A0ABS1UW94_9PROT|nr:NAD(P)-dependent oxidoreductase [Belnapia mucosa]MBL6453748.1 NAD(P)-dependent oxidoreductase [Belnapia mucosa]